MLCTKLILILTVFSQFALLAGQEVPFTLEDRDRIIKIEEKLNSQQQQINDLKESTKVQINDLKESTQMQINDLKESINDLRTLFYWGFGILLSLMLFLLGYIIWDRRTATFPLQEKTAHLNEQIQQLLITLREYSKDQPRLQDILRTHGLM